MGRRLPVADRDFRPAYVVWELTLACDQRCTHCGSRAGTERSGELTIEEAVRLARQLGEMRAEEVVLIGGEAYLHPGFLDVVAALRSAGVRPVMTTGGRGVSSELARAMAGAGLAAASVSIDGLERTHDRMRATAGGFAAATAALNHLAHAGIAIAANTNVNRWNEADLEPLYEHLAAQGIRSWQVQLTTPLGRAADRPDMILQPYDLLALVPRIARLKERALADGISLMPGNNLGYFGPEEALLRSPHAGGRDHFRGCQAGRYVLGIESNGAIKGCPSLQPAFVGGNVRDRSLRAIWDDAPELRFARARDDEPTAHLWGYCAACDFADTCMGGCTFTAYAFFGRAGNNPYCHFRARQLAARGLRERLVQTASAPGDPFDHARFEIVTEPLDAPEPRVAPRERLLHVRRRLAGVRSG
jgi:radical SAM protein with 4Fe4S-binding SPASM domain